MYSDWKVKLKMSLLINDITILENSRKSTWKLPELINLTKLKESVYLEVSFLLYLQIVNFEHPFVNCTLL